MVCEHVLLGLAKPGSRPGQCTALEAHRRTACPQCVSLCTRPTPAVPAASCLTPCTNIRTLELNNRAAGAHPQLGAPSRRCARTLGRAPSPKALVQAGIVLGWQRSTYSAKLAVPGTPDMQPSLFWLAISPATAVVTNSCVHGVFLLEDLFCVRYLSGMVLEPSDQVTRNQLQPIQSERRSSRRPAKYSLVPLPSCCKKSACSRTLAAELGRPYVPRGVLVNLIPPAAQRPPHPTARRGGRGTSAAASSGLAPRLPAGAARPSCRRPRVRPAATARRLLLLLLLPPPPDTPSFPRAHRPTPQRPMPRCICRWCCRCWKVHAAPPPAAGALASQAELKACQYRVPGDEREAARAHRAACGLRLAARGARRAAGHRTGEEDAAPATALATARSGGGAEGRGDDLALSDRRSGHARVPASARREGAYAPAQPRHDLYKCRRCAGGAGLTLGGYGSEPSSRVWGDSVEHSFTWIHCLCWLLPRASLCR
eukprot:scaffold1042_cov401-Prasinococcus_capsulatus_cf.AAC.13